MTQPKYSTSFVGYNGEGVPFSFTVNGEDLNQFVQNVGALLHRFPLLGDFNMMMHSPPDGSMRPRTFKIIGWIRGETNDRFNPGTLLPCVWLYCDMPWLQFACATVYSEDLKKLPIDWTTGRNAGGSPPPLPAAKDRWTPCDFNILMMPSIGQDGEPEKNKNGGIKYRFSEVIDNDAAQNTQTMKPEDGFSGEAPAQTQRPAAAAPVPQQAQRPAPAPAPTQAPAQRPAPAPTPRPAPPPPPPASEEDTLYLTAFARGSYDPEVQLEPETKSFIDRMRVLDKQSEIPMSINHLTAEGMQKRGQYEFLAGTIDTIGKNETGYGDLHKEVLSFILARPVSKSAPPTERARAIFDEIYAGTQERPSQTFNQASYNAVVEATYIVKGIEDRLKEDEAMANQTHPMSGQGSPEQGDIPF